MPTHGCGKPRERRQKQRDVVIEAVQHKQADERHERQSPDFLRSLAKVGQRCQCFIHRAFRRECRLAVSGSIQDVMAVERVGQVFADQMAQQSLADWLGHSFADQRESQRIAAA